MPNQGTTSILRTIARERKRNAPVYKRGTKGRSDYPKIEREVYGVYRRGMGGSNDDIVDHI